MHRGKDELISIMMGSMLPVAKAKYGSPTRHMNKNPAMFCNNSTSEHIPSMFFYYDFYVGYVCSKENGLWLHSLRSKTKLSAVLMPVLCCPNSAPANSSKPVIIHKSSNRQTFKDSTLGYFWDNHKMQSFIVHMSF